MGNALMDWGARSSVSLKILVAVGMASSCTLPTQATTTPPPQPQMRADDALLQWVGDSGINIVRMPQRPSTGRQPSTIPAVQQTPAIPPRPSEPAQPQGRLLKLQVRLGSQPNDGEKGWLGIEMESLELPLALSLGLPTGDGVFLLRPSGPIAFKDILDVAGAYLGPCPSVQTDWTPLQSRSGLFSKWGTPAVTDADLWQYASFAVEA
jgi:hypothetical protein